MKYGYFQEEIQKACWKKDKSNRRPPDHPVVTATFEPFASLIAGNIQIPQEADILDIGCGNGFLQYALEKDFKCVVGIDFSQEMLIINPCVNKIQGTALSLPFPDNSFDIVVASNLLHHLVERERYQTITEMIRVSRHTIVSIEPNRNNPFMWLFAVLKKEERMALQFSRRYLENFFKKNPVESCRIFITGWIVPNKAPIWWIPIGKILVKSIFRKFGLYICCIGKIKDAATDSIWQG